MRWKLVPNCLIWLRQISKDSARRTLIILQRIGKEVGAKLIGMVKRNTKGFCKDTIDNLTKDWPGGSYLVLRIKTMVPRYRPLIAIR